jgi:hypothetical protein
MATGRGGTSVPGLLFYLGFLLGCEGTRRKSQFFLKVLVSPQASNVRTLRNITFSILANSQGSNHFQDL